MSMLQSERADFKSYHYDKNDFQKNLKFFKNIFDFQEKLLSPNFYLES
jgi:hypothetical protein